MFERQGKDTREKIQVRRIRVFLFSLFSFFFSLSTAQAELLPAEGELSDPTKPPDYQAVSAGAAGVVAVAEPRWVLKSTLISLSRRSAILNGRAVKEGEQLGEGVKVLKIQPGSVLLKGAQGEFSVNLLSVSIKMPDKTWSSAP